MSTEVNEKTVSDLSNEVSANVVSSVVGLPSSADDILIEFKKRVVTDKNIQTALSNKDFSLYNSLINNLRVELNVPEFHYKK